MPPDSCLILAFFVFELLCVSTAGLASWTGFESRNCPVHGSLARDPGIPKSRFTCTKVSIITDHHQYNDVRKVLDKVKT